MYLCIDILYVQQYNYQVEFEWDKQKGKSNLKKHGISFHDAEKVFESIRLTLTDSRMDYGEERIVTIGLIDKRVCVVVYTKRQDAIRIISARRANERERRRYNERIKKEGI
jgi:uncharacterized DUF497 family protein